MTVCAIAEELNVVLASVSWIGRKWSNSLKLFMEEGTVWSNIQLSETMILVGFWFVRFVLHTLIL